MPMPEDIEIFKVVPISPHLNTIQKAAKHLDKRVEA
jgi:hypothetical protein